MNNIEKKNLAKAICYNNSTLGEKKSISSVPEQIKQDSKEEKEVKKISYARQDNSMKCKERAVSTERLQDAIIWSEILAKPVGKRRKRRSLWE